jgi:hypothetical protein
MLSPVRAMPNRLHRVQGAKSRSSFVPYASVLPDMGALVRRARQVDRVLLVHTEFEPSRDALPDPYDGPAQ